MEMEKEKSSETESSSAVRSIREENRQESERIRKEMRYKITTVHRSGLDKLQPSSYSSTNVQSMAVTLKKKRSVNREFLVELSQALAESEENSTIFVGVDGTLQSLCSFLTGGDSTLQLEATYCLANVAVWENEKKLGNQIASTAGAYLVTLLGSGNSLLQEACCWALSNMLPQGKSILCAQGLIDKLLTLFASPICDVQSSAVQCVIQFINTTSPSEDDLEKIAAHVDELLTEKKVDDVSVSWLIYSLSCFRICDPYVFVERVIAWSVNSLRHQLEGEKKVIVLVPVVRFLTNVCTSCGELVATKVNDNDFANLILQLLNSSYEPICKETMLLVANIVNNSAIATDSRFRNLIEKSVCNVYCLF